jgi:allene oxide cyclase
VAPDDPPDRFLDRSTRACAVVLPIVRGGRPAVRNPIEGGTLLMRRTLTIAVPLVGIALAGSISAFASGPKASLARATTTVSVVEHAATDVTTDTGSKGDSAGDVLTFANVLYNARDTRKIGTDQGFCVRTVEGKAYECTWTNLLRGGHVAVQGPFYDSADSTFAIVGGTGRYRNARGTMKLRARAGGRKYSFVFHITR